MTTSCIRSSVYQEGGSLPPPGDFLVQAYDIWPIAWKDIIAVVSEPRTAPWMLSPKVTTTIAIAASCQRSRSNDPFFRRYACVQRWTVASMRRQNFDLKQALTFKPRGGAVSSSSTMTFAPFRATELTRPADECEPRSWLTEAPRMKPTATQANIVTDELTTTASETGPGSSSIIKLYILSTCWQQMETLP